MRFQYLALSLFGVLLILPDSEVFAQRGGRGRGGYGGGGASRGGGGYSGGGARGGFGGGGESHGGGYGGGGPRGGGYGGEPRGGGGYGGGEPRGGGGYGGEAGARPGAGNYAGAGSRPGAGNYAGAPGSYAGSRPGAGNYAGAPGSSSRAYPGTGTGQVGSNLGQAGSNLGQVGSNFGQAGSNLGQVGSNLGQAGSNLGQNLGQVGDNLGQAASNWAGRPYGSYYNGWGNLAGLAGTYAGLANYYPNYGAAWYAGYPNAWWSTGLTDGSVYTNPGYTTVAGQVGLPAQPAAYDYGSNVVVQPDGVYVNGDSAGTPQQYFNQANQIASAGRAAPPDSNTKWLPLGVFAVVEGNATNSDDVFQLAVSPEGLIRGNYNNVQTKQVDKITGSVDKTTQRAAWTIGSDKLPVYEAGIANLTKNSTPILVQLGGGQTHQVTLVRLQPPKQPAGTASGAGGTPQP
jgi:hypothetical protein